MPSADDHRKYTRTTAQPQPKSGALDPFDEWESQAAEREAADRELKLALAAERDAALAAQAASEANRIHLRDILAAEREKVQAAEAVRAGEEAREATRLEARQAALLAELGDIGAEFAITGAQPAPARNVWTCPPVPAYEPATREFGGQTWDLLPLDTPLRCGDEEDYHGVWRPRPTQATAGRYGMAVHERVAAQAAVASAVAAHGPDSREAQKAKAALDRAQQRQSELLTASDDETVKAWDRIDAWRAGAGRAEWNASRRKRIQPNADLSSLSPEEKARYERDRRSDANWFRRQRDAGKSEPEIAGLYLRRLAERQEKRAEIEKEAA